MDDLGDAPISTILILRMAVLEAINTKITWDVT
jgi:hypothetical protein